ncbi:MAG: class I SAM-dependent methyltransferase [Candidatus Riflebacteria bacterium]|nr:class I SAM-dependent methyltransferase [Candidatus Riflebacteria bacterium]
MPQWYEQLFANFARRYEEQPFTQGTIGETDFLEAEAKRVGARSILDIGCGTGRHAIELARRGFRVTGIDLSPAQLRRARENARETGVTVDFRRKDARTFRCRERFDLAIMLCEGGFSLMETDAMNVAILRSATRALQPGGTFIFTCLNALFPLAHTAFGNPSRPAGDGFPNPRVDLMTLRSTEEMTVADDSGTKLAIRSDERYFMPTEITWYLQSLGCSPIGIFGCRLGAFRREPLTPDHFEMLVITQTRA